MRIGGPSLRFSFLIRQSCGTTSDISGLRVTRQVATVGNFRPAIQPANRGIQTMMRTWLLAATLRSCASGHRPS